MTSVISSRAFVCARCSAWAAWPLQTQWQPQSRTANNKKFSTSTLRRKHGAIASLEPPPSAPTELNDLLQQLRNTVFLPAHLNQAQKRLVFQTRNHKILETDPVTVTIGGEDFLLKPIDVTKDQPATDTSLKRAVAYMGTDEDAWRSVFIELLEEFKASGRRFSESLWYWLFQRAAIEYGMVGVAVEAAKRASTTRWHLNTIQRVCQMLWGCRVVAMGGKTEEAGAAWEEHNTSLALRYAEQIAQLLGRPDHCGKAQFSVENPDPRTQPECIGVVLELAAVRALKHLNGVDEDGKVAAYAQRLLAALEQSADIGMDANAKFHAEEGRKAMAADPQLLRWVPVYNGIDTAMQVLGEAMPQQELAKAKLKEIKDFMDQMAEMQVANEPYSDRGPRQGLGWYRKL